MHQIYEYQLRVVAWITETLYSLARDARKATQRKRNAAIAAMRNRNLRQEDAYFSMHMQVKQEAADLRALAEDADDRAADIATQLHTVSAQNQAAEFEYAERINKIGL